MKMFNALKRIAMYPEKCMYLEHDNSALYYRVHNTLYITNNPPHDVELGELARLLLHFEYEWIVADLEASVMQMFPGQAGFVELEAIDCLRRDPPVLVP
jgi:hypothetical protein